ncbi:helix-turn-helix domain-containing protein [Vallitalea okinawensis]|uniref:helix-turn-helix domain-containing protein n=1 Tax=Vallitalea okinawensis TaxID=2078660 RepID=UPI0014797881|nr:helix-turn-helix domain-containing protein [Vallitalea okinawensis]
MNRLLLESFTKDRIYYGETLIKNEGNVTLHTHTFFEIFFIIEGEIDYFINDKYIHLKTGTIQLVFPHNKHAFFRKHTFKTARIINIAFVSELIGEDIHYLLSEADRDSKKELEVFKFDSNLFNLLVKRSLQLKNAISIREKELMLFNILMNYLIEYIHVNNSHINAAPLWLKNAMEEMQKEEHFKTGLRSFIKLSSKSQEHLTRMLKQHYGYTPTKYINDLRLEYVSEKLISTDLQISVIIYDSGFNNIAYFETLFKEKYHVTPRRYRQLNQKLFK